jgi:hypothetical protein
MQAGQFKHPAHVTRRGCDSQPTASRSHSLVGANQHRDSARTAKLDIGQVHHNTEATSISPAITRIEQPASPRLANANSTPGSIPPKQLVRPLPRLGSTRQHRHHPYAGISGRVSGSGIPGTHPNVRSHSTRQSQRYLTTLLTERSPPDPIPRCLVPGQIPTCPNRRRPFPRRLPRFPPRSHTSPEFRNSTRLNSGRRTWALGVAVFCQRPA